MPLNWGFFKGVCMGQTISKQIKQFEHCKKDILKFISKTEYKQAKVSEFSSLIGIPLVVIYYYYWKTKGIEDARGSFERLAVYYDLEIDI